MIANLSLKESLYIELKQEIEALCQGETNLGANLANIVAAVHHKFKFWWTGFYHVDGESLVLGSFQGPVACTRIAKGKGVCGSAWEQGKSIVVQDVHAFPGHIACSAMSASEIVLPIFNSQHEVLMVLDIDSEHLNTFDQSDQKHLEQICQFISGLL